ncbi:MAG: hypothetical protein LBH32_05445 [Dysgonamonadaceae bacterium]|jgi:hypothetical protein|nr:hypothetical protein [Dysgonamonadaceae bacterium]
MEKIRLKVRWGISVKIITVSVILILAAVEYYAISSLINSKGWIEMAIICAIPLIMLYFATESPAFIELNETGVLLHKLSRKLIRYEQIENVDCYKPDKSEIRFWGSGGFFGFIGKFSNAKIGFYQSYTGDYSQAFLIQTKDNKKYVCSCENRDLLINTIKKQIQL